MMALGLGVAACRANARQWAEGAAYAGIETSAASGQSRAVFFGADGARLGATALDFRAHGLARHGAMIVVFPRRPGNRFAIIDQATLMVRRVVTAPAGRHFYGHGAFTRDGRHLLVTENDLATLQGSVGVYGISGTVRRLGHVALPGSGPHDLVRADDRDRFHIALGGLETHPDYGRTPLNLSSFRSQILTLDFATDAVASMGHWPGAEGVSLRHLAQDGKGRLYVGGQVPGPGVAGDAVLWLVDDGRVDRLEAGRLLGGYVSSVTAHGDRAVATSKEAGLAVTLDGGDVVDTVHLDGASAVAMGDAFMAMSGFQTLTINAAEVPVSPSFEFDNHGMMLR